MTPIKSNGDRKEYLKQRDAYISQMYKWQSFVDIGIAVLTLRHYIILTLYGGYAVQFFAVYCTIMFWFIGMYASKEVFWVMVQYIDADYVGDMEKLDKLQKKVDILNKWIDISNIWCSLLIVAQVITLFVYIINTFN